MRTAVRRVVGAAGLVAAIMTLPVPALGAASPPGNDRWSVLEGSCDGQPVHVLDPPGGSSGFIVGGSVGVGKVFTLIDDATGKVIDEFVEGKGIPEERLVECVFLIPDYPIPG